MDSPTDSQTLKLIFNLRFREGDGSWSAKCRRVKQLPIFYYHSVGSAPPQSQALSEFRGNLEAIRRRGLKTVTVAEIVHSPVPLENCVALSFDDGLLDNYTKVFPMLLEYGMVGTFYCVPGYDKVTRWVNPWTGGWSDIQRPMFTQPFLSVNAAQRDEMARHGMEIGSHTYTHRKLTEVPKVQLDRELVESKKVLEDQLGRAVTTFCYPNGRFNRDIVARVKAAGYKAACSTLPGYYGGTRNPHLMNRFLVETPGHFEDVLDGKAWSLPTLLAIVGRKVGIKTR